MLIKIGPCDCRSIKDLESRLPDVQKELDKVNKDLEGAVQAETKFDEQVNLDIQFCIWPNTHAVCLGIFTVWVGKPLGCLACLFVTYLSQISELFKRLHHCKHQPVISLLPAPHPSTRPCIVCFIAPNELKLHQVSHSQALISFTCVLYQEPFITHFLGVSCYGSLCIRWIL